MMVKLNDTNKFNENYYSIFEFDVHLSNISKSLLDKQLTRVKLIEIKKIIVIYNLWVEHLF